MSQTPQRILIFEPDAEGHALEWLKHLVDFVARENANTEIWLLVSEGLYHPLVRTVPNARVKLIMLTPSEQADCMRRPLLLAALARWRTMRRHLRSSGAQHGFFLTLDLLSVPLAFGLRAGGARLSGILFRPSVHYGEIGPYRPSWRERLRDIRKAVFYRLMLLNPALERVLSLDPFFPAYARTHYLKGHKVVALPDPAHPAIEAANSNEIADYVPPGRLGFLLFGYLAERKGPLAVLDALLLLPPDVADRIAVLFAGKVAPELAERLAERQQMLTERCPGLWFKIDGRRLDDVELAGIVKRSDVVLAPYQRFVGSSGVLLWAAQNGRPVIAQEYGLVGRLTREHRLGISVDSSDPARLACEITRMVRQGPATFIDRPAAAEFAAAQTPHRFAALVLSV